MESRYSQHTSNYNAFFAVKKNYRDKSETTISSSLYSKSEVGVPSTRYTLNKKDGINTFNELTGTFIDSITGIISSITIKEEKKLGDGRSIPEQIEIKMPTPDRKVDSITMFLDSKAGDNFMRRIVNVDFSEPVTIKPYAYYKDDVLKEGLSLEQDGERLEDHYTTFVDKKPVNQNGLEQFDEMASKTKLIKNDKLRKDGWKSYFTNISVFLTEEMKKLPVFNATVTTKVSDAKFNEIATGETDEVAEPPF